MPERLPLSTLLSQALIAFTIELDNEWERRMTYRTSRFGGRGPWGTSLRQYSNFMRLVPEEGIRAAELAQAARAQPQLDGMRRWGYIRLEPAKFVRPTLSGLRASATWKPLPDEIEERWRGRFGAGTIDGLRVSLEALVGDVGVGLPDWLTGTYGGFAAPRVPGGPAAPPRRLPLSALLSIPLHAFALRYEEEAAVSLMYSANLLQRLDGDGMPAAQLARSAGVAIEAVRTALGILGKRGFVEAGRVVRLTDQGRAEWQVYEALPAQIEAGWGDIGEVRPRLEAVLTPGAPLWPQIDPPPESWRSRVSRPAALPHHPMPRQGGHPDGA